MKARNKIGAVIGVTFSFLFVAASFQNCAKQVDFASLEEVTLNGGGSDITNGSSNSKPQTDIDGAPVDAKQTLESMMSLLGLSRTDINMTAVNAEINYRRNLLMAQNDLTLVNSPSIIAITSLAGVVCQQAVTKEKKGAKDLFKYIDFAKGPSSYGKLGAINTYVSLVDRFWMRQPSKEELALISQTVDEYFSTLDSAAMSKATESDKLAVFICTGMLSVPDSYLL
ncbi:hypothetical protein EZJ49_08425 [Bdellovibrio bacteriovorus]|uniref:hypothetical protein n=1 Tax=Bdellovibrio bacteriovorus TaxID=959 RepID=UPI0021CED433|nr:hypothetical protein [Bdellovibrio bacteriovorus]UXR63100.1 hypothetical protein EZJ49_08425 [Bdellovibrio bacteriovorus]